MPSSPTFTTLLLISILCLIFPTNSSPPHKIAISDVITISSPDGNHLKGVAEKLEVLRMAANSNLPQPWTSKGRTPDSIQCTREGKHNEKCAPGTVVMPQFVSDMIRLQQHDLQFDRPLEEVQVLGTHNSHIDLAHNYGIMQHDLTLLVQLVQPHQAVQISNQWLSIRDQMNMGVRMLELDIHWLFGTIRICHAGGVHLESLNKIIAWLEEKLHITIHFDSESIGCFSSKDITAKEALQEVRSWLDANPDEVIMVMFDDQENLERWDKVHILNEAIEATVGELVFTPAEKERFFPTPGHWPSMKQLVDMNKRLILNTIADFHNETRPYMFLRNKEMWQEASAVERFESYPKCEPKVQPHTNVSLFRLNSAALWYANFHIEEEWISGEFLKQIMMCPDKNIISLELVTPDLVAAAVWSFKEEDWDTKQGGFIWMDGVSKSWKLDRSGEAARRIACKQVGVKSSLNTHWVLSNGAKPFKQSEGSCPPGYTFALPTNALENFQVQQLVEGSSSGVWLAGEIQQGKLHKIAS